MLLLMESQEMLFGLPWLFFTGVAFWVPGSEIWIHLVLMIDELKLSVLDNILR